MIYLPKRTRLSRRSLIRNTAVLAFAAPAFRLIDEVEAQQGGPRRAVFGFTPVGPMASLGPATGTPGTDFTIKPWWEAYEPHKSDGIFISNLAVTAAGTPKMTAHSAGGQVYDGFGADNKSVDGPSIDHLIAQRMLQEGRSAVKPNVVYGLHNTGGGSRTPFATAKNRPVVPIMDPEKAWADLFAGFMAPEASPQNTLRAELALERGESMLDYAHSECQKLTSALGAEGAQLLDAHCTALRTAEENLAKKFGIGGGASACAIPDIGNAKGTRDEDFDERTLAFNDIIVAALSCELTHVVGYQMGCAGSRLTLPKKYGVSSPWHSYTHNISKESAVEASEIFTRRWAEVYSDLVTKLKTTNDAFGRPLIETTAFQVKSEMGGDEGSTDIHPESGCPEMIFGGGDFFAKGKYIRGSADNRKESGANFVQGGKEAAQVLLAMQHYMGMTDVDRVGRTQNIAPWEPLLG